MVVMPHMQEFANSQLEVLEACPWCGLTDVIHLFYENGFPYVQCSQCTLIYLQKRVKEEFVAQIYNSSDYHAHNLSSEMRVSRKRLNLIGELPKSTRIFEDGAGVGSFINICKQNGFRAEGCDISLSSIAKAMDYYGVKLHQGPLVSLNLQSNSIDLFACFNLLSHLYKPWSYFKEVRRLISDQGIFILRTGDRTGKMANIRHGHWSAPEHVFHFTVNVLEQMLRKENFKIVWIKPAFDSLYPYFPFKYSFTHANYVSEKISIGISLVVSSIWHHLRLPKDDVYILVKPI